jgi:hypothetical protein
VVTWVGGGALTTPGVSQRGAPVAPTAQVVLSPQMVALQGSVMQPSAATHTSPSAHPIV